jgi:predicted ATPase/DNA-binding SARP family transcriptional activator
LGYFQVTLGGERVTAFGYDKVRALLAFLAVESGHPHRRESLCALLWPDQPPKAARHSLNQALLKLRQALKDQKVDFPRLISDRETVQFNLHDDDYLDITKFDAHLDACRIHPHTSPEQCEYCSQRMEAAVDLYKGDFLRGLILGDSSAFEDWVIIQRERRHKRVLNALHILTTHYLQRGLCAQAQKYAQLQVEMEPFREEGHRALMHALACSGQRSAALAQYEACKKHLAEELSVAPTQETQDLYTRIQQSGDTRPNNLPKQLTSLVGRERELISISEKLANPNCRMLTLCGPGGIGKTALALRAARANQGMFWDGVYFVPLDSLTQPEQILTAVIGVLPFDQSGPTPPQKQLNNYLREKTILLVLDNMEHLVEAAPLVIELLENALHLKVLITSREIINIRPEWVFPLEGLPYPNMDKSAASEVLLTYDAVALFIQRAQQIAGDFSPSEAQLRAIGQICQIMLGTPIGIELAAAWARSFSPEDIEQEIRNNLDFLTTSKRDVSPRHRSLRATFEHSWQLLSQDDQDILEKLAIFRGTFSIDAAQKIANASRIALLSLAEKSLLHSNEMNRFQMHHLIQQFVAEKLASQPQLDYETRARHSEYFTTFLEQKGQTYHHEKKRQILEEIYQEFDNVRMSWAWAIGAKQWEAINRAKEGLWDFLDAYGWYLEGVEVFEQTITRLQGSRNISEEEKKLLLGKLYARQGLFFIHLGKLDDADNVLKHSLNLLPNSDERALPLSYLGAIAQLRGEFEKACEFGEESLRISRETGRRAGEAFCLNLLGNIASAQGDWDRAKEIHAQNLSIRQELGDHQGAAIARNNLGNIAHAQGDLLQAKNLYRQGYSSFQVLNHRLGLAVTIGNVGYMAWKLGNYKEAKQCYEESLTIKRDLGNQHGIATTLTNLGEAATSLGDFNEARRNLLEALSLSKSIQAAPLVLEILVCYAIMLRQNEKIEKAMEVLLVVLSSSSDRRETRERAEQLRNEWSTLLESEAVRQCNEKASNVQVDDLVADVLAEMVN